jgi:KDO2-lipid IV(A) lauroyltransferase
MPAGPAVLAIKEGLPLVAAHVSYTLSGIHIDFQAIEISSNASESVQIAATVQNLARAFEKGIAERPQDWHMLQRIWINEGIYK